jgi:hypothetical protein
LRDCGCEDRGRHKRTCLKHVERKEKGIAPAEEYLQGVSLHELYIAGYGKPPHLSWYPDKDRQKTVERRIEKLVRRYKAFYLTTNSVDDLSEEEETWFIDGGNWASKKDSDGYNILIGHITNCLEFLDGRKPIWKKRRVNS